ncbi:MAG TPA: hypothetical protein VLF40_04740 [Candidatus Saccharimonadales bacterium]|nr:hypothetical protein [Candidatus Saccharimonadales bacterium]
MAEMMQMDAGRSVWRSLPAAGRSAVVFLGMAGSLRLRHERLGMYYAAQGGKYVVFRETERAAARGEPVVLVVGFRLKLIRSSRLLHWLFQRVCILTTPFWSGLPGFRTKLWLVDPATKNYLGIYDWRGEPQAQGYLDFLLPVLRFFSTGGSVWAQQFPATALDGYLQAVHSVVTPSNASG